jgi:hypothetical protein
MHPAFSKTDRFILKTFGNDEDAAVKSLRAKHPGLDIQKDDLTGQIKARAQGEKAYRVLDPDTGMFSSDFVNDLSDIAGDVGTGVITGGATAGGAALGAAAGAAAGGVGAVPGAIMGGVAGGGLSSAALEALRQAAGYGLGVNEEVKGGDIALAGGLGAISAPLFGGGATASQIAAKSAGKGLMTVANPLLGAKEGAKNLAKSTGRAVLNKTPFAKGLAAKIPANSDNSLAALVQREGGDLALAETISKAQAGLPTHLLRKSKGVLPKIGETTSGIQADVIRNYAADPEGVEKLTEGGVRNLMEGTIDDTARKFAERKEKIGGLMNEARSMADAMADMADLAEGPGASSVYKVDTTKVMQPFQELLATAGNPAGKTRVEQAEAEAVAQIFQNYFVETTETTGQDAFGEALQYITSGKPLKASEAFALKDRLKKLASFQDAQNFKASLPKGADHVDKQVISAARDAISILDAELDRVTKTAAQDGASKLGIPADPDFSYRFAQDEYATMMEDQKSLASLLRNPRATHSLLSNLGNKSRITDLEGIQAIDKRYGTKLGEMSKKISAHKHFSDAPWLAMSSGGTTSTSRTVPLSESFGSLGYYLGANSGLGQGGAGVGAALGKGMGSVIGGPAAIKRYIRMNKATGKGKDLLRDAGLAPNRVITPWMMMEQKEIDE